MGIALVESASADDPAAASLWRPRLQGGLSAVAPACGWQPTAHLREAPMGVPWTRHAHAVLVVGPQQSGQLPQGAVARVQMVCGRCDRPRMVHWHASFSGGFFRTRPCTNAGLWPAGGRPAFCEACGVQGAGGGLLWDIFGGGMVGVFLVSEVSFGSHGLLLFVGVCLSGGSPTHPARSPHNTSDQTDSVP